MTSRISGGKHYLERKPSANEEAYKKHQTAQGTGVRASAEKASQTAAKQLTTTASSSGTPLSSSQKFVPPPPPNGAAVAPLRPPPRLPTEFEYCKEAAAEAPLFKSLKKLATPPDDSFVPGTPDSQPRVAPCAPPDSFERTKRIVTNMLTNAEQLKPQSLPGRVQERVLFNSDHFKLILSFLGSSLFSEALFISTSPQKPAQIPPTAVTTAPKPPLKTEEELFKERAAKIEVVCYQAWNHTTRAIHIGAHLETAKNWLHTYVPVAETKDCLLLGRISRRSLVIFYNLHGQKFAKLNYKCKWRAFFSYHIIIEKNNTFTRKDIQVTNNVEQSFCSETCIEAVRQLDLPFLKETFANANSEQLAYLLHFKKDDISTGNQHPLFMIALQLEMTGKEKEIDEMREFLYQQVKSFGFVNQHLFPFNPNNTIDNVFKYLAVPSRYVQSAKTGLTLIKDNLQGLKWLVNRVQKDEAEAKTAAQTASASASGSATMQTNILIKQLNGVLANPLLLHPHSCLNCIRYLLELQRKKDNFNAECLEFVQNSGQFSTTEFKERMALIKGRVSFNHCVDHNNFHTIPCFWLLIKSTETELKAFYDASHVNSQNRFTTKMINAFYAMDLATIKYESNDKVFVLIDKDKKREALRKLVQEVKDLPKEKKTTLHEAITAMRFLAITDGEDISHRIKFLEELVTIGGLDPNLRCKRQGKYLKWKADPDGITIKEMIVEWNPTQEQPKAPYPHLKSRVAHAQPLSEQLKAFINEHCTEPNKAPPPAPAKKK